MLIFAPWIPTRKKDLYRIVDVSWIKKWDIVYDLWSWDWKVLFAIADKIDCKLIWIESYLPLFIFSILKKRIFYKDKNISFKLWNFFSYNLGDASHIYVFWLDSKMKKLEAKLRNDCKKWTKIISYAFDFLGWKEIKKDKPTSKDLSIYIYEI